MDEIIKERKIITKFIELYCDLPCLWDKGSEIYKNREQKIQAWSVLKDKLTELEPDANIESTKKKIEHMRSSHQREAKKVRESKTTASQASEVHIPQLWYYKILNPVFQKKDKLSKKWVDTSMSDEEQQSKQIEDQSSECNTKYPSKCKKLKVTETAKELSQKDCLKKHFHEQTFEEVEEEKNNEAKTNNHKKIKLTMTPKELLHADTQLKCQQQVSERIHRENITNTVKQDYIRKLQHIEIAQPLRTDCTKPNSFAVYVGEQLDQIATFQRQVAEKLISEVLFLGKTGKLRFDSRIKQHSMSHAQRSSSSSSKSASPSPEYIQLSPSPPIQTPEGDGNDPLYSLPAEEISSNDSILKTLLQD